ncbi:MAG: YbdD/YjiX family protein [Gemmatimonadaceae bacterium]
MPISALIQRIGTTIRTILGVPDYERYVAHVRAVHPGEEPVSEREFQRQRLEARARPGSRCC